MTFLHFSELGVSVPLHDVQKAAEAAGYQLVKKDRIQTVRQQSLFPTEVREWAGEVYRKSHATHIGQEMLRVGAIEFEEIPNPENLYKIHPEMALRSTAHFIKLAPKVDK